MRAEHYAPPAISYETLETAYMRHAHPDSEPDELWVSPRDFETIVDNFDGLRPGERLFTPEERQKFRDDGLRFNNARMFPKGKFGCKMVILKAGTVVATETICGPLPLSTL